MDSLPTQTALWPLVVYFGAVVGLVGVMLLLSWILGERHHGHATGEPFESGIVTVGFARYRFPVKFYLMAMFFVIFDLESVFIFAWAVAFRQTGWFGYTEAALFLGILLAALVYLWRCGALEWGPGMRGRYAKSS